MNSKVRQILDMNAFDKSSVRAGEEPVALRRRLDNLGAASVLFYRDPLEIASAAGSWMISRDGTHYLDFYNNVPSVGHSHSAVVRAVADQMAVLNTNTRYLVDIVDDYLERLKARLPQGLTNVVMTCSGSEANDLAMRVAQKATGGTGFIVTENAYHGNTALVTQVSPSALKRAVLPDHVVTIPAPSAQVFGADLAAGFADSLRAAIATLAARGHRPAAFICDSIFSSDGIFADPAGFLQPAVAAIRAAGGLFLADEVQPGFARTGDCFWGFARHGVTPDLITMGKPMGNGFPMAAMAARPDSLEKFCEEVGYFNTFGGNPVAAAAGLAVLSVIDDEGLQQNAQTVGAHLKSRLSALAAADPRIADVRGAGLFIGLELCAPDAPDSPDPGFALTLIDRLKERHILIGAAGRFGNTLKIRPPLCLSMDEADIFADALGASLAG
ncbi:aspartate aminotransferase family protein [Actibacterium sp. D379-3]